MPKAISPDRQFLLLRDAYGDREGIVLWDIGENKEITRFPLTTGYGGRTQYRFLTNRLILLSPTEESQIDWRLYTVGGQFVDGFTYQVDGDHVANIYFSEDLTRAVVNLVVPDGGGRTNAALVDTAAFKEWLASLDLLYKPTTGVCTEERVNVWEYPSTQARVLGQLSQGDRLEVTDRSGKKVRIGELEDWWYRVQRVTDGRSGWVYGAYLKLASYQEEIVSKPQI